MLKQYRTWLLAFPFAFSAHAQSALSLKDAYRSALQKNETLPIEESRKRQTEEQIAQARGVFFPQLYGSLTYFRQDPSSSPTTAEQTTGKLTLSQALFRGGASYGAYQAAQAELEASEALVLQARLSLYVEVARGYYDIHALEQDLRDLGDSLDLTGKRLKELQSRGRIGRSRGGESLTAQAQVEVVQAQIEATKTQLRVARDRFALLTGADPASPLAPPAFRFPALKPLKDYVALVDRRPDLAVLRKKAESADEAITVARAGHFPQADAQANYYPLRTGTTTPRTWDLTLSLTVPLFSGGTTHANVNEAAEKHKERELLLAQGRRSAEADVRVAYGNVEGGLAQIRALEQAVSTNERNYKEQSKDYGLGLVTNLDVLQSLNGFLDAKRSLDRVRFQTLLAYTELDVATGSLSEGDLR